MSDQPQLDQLVQDYLEGLATEAQVADLNRQLRTDPEARRRFRELLNLDSAIAAAVATDAPSEDVPPHAAVAEAPSRDAHAQNGRRRLRRGVAPWFSLSLAIAASVVAIAGTILWSVVKQPDCAKVVSATGAGDLQAGMILHSEPHRITSGTVELVTENGTQIVIEAPASFYFESQQRLQLEYGRLAAEVSPRGQGFAVITPTGQAIDLGTKFGVDMPQNGEAEIHVFQGEVIAQSTDGGTLSNLRNGQAFRLQTAAGVPSTFRSAAFILPGEVDLLNAAISAGQPAQSRRALQKLQRDPDLIALLDFESDEPLPGVYRNVQGRWPGSQAAEFVSLGDHMKLNVGGERAWPQLTLAAWVRLDRLGEPFHSLLHTDGWEEEQGQVHWMVTDRMTMRLALFDVTLDPPVAPFPDSQTSVLPEQGRWVHLAVSYDSEAKKVRFYFNGEFDNEVTLGQAYLARLGSARIGNWDTKDRTLSGRIDEMLIMGRTMSDAEIKSLYQAGNPYR